MQEAQAVQTGLPEGQSVVLVPDAQEKVNLPAGHSGLTTEDTGNKDTPASSNGSGSDSGDTTISGGGSTGGGGGSGSNGNQDNTITPGGNDVPAPTPTPDPTLHQPQHRISRIMEMIRRL